MSLSLLVDAGLTLLVLGPAVWVIAAAATYRAAEGFVAFGLLVSLVLDLPVGSCIVLVSTVLFAMTVLISPKRKRKMEQREVNS